MCAIALYAVLGAGGEYSRPLPRDAIGPEPTRPHVDLGPIVRPSGLKGAERIARYLGEEADRHRDLPTPTRSALRDLGDDALSGRISVAEFEMRRTELLTS